MDAENILIKLSSLYFFKKHSCSFLKGCISTYVHVDMYVYKQEPQTTASTILNATRFTLEIQNKARCPPSPLLFDIVCSVIVRQERKAQE